MAKRIVMGDEARAKLQAGVNKLADSVGCTLGPRGRTVIVQKPYGSPMITKDGVSVAESIDLEDPVENQGAKLVREVAYKTNVEAGDGTTTATALAQAIFNAGLKAVAQGANPVYVKKGIDDAAQEAITFLRHHSSPVEGTQSLSVASISANDPVLGAVVDEAIKSVGTDGVVTVVESQAIGVTTEVVTGMKLDKGYVSPFMATSDADSKIDLEDALVVATDLRIGTSLQLKPLLEYVHANNRKLLLFCDDVSGEALNTLVLNKLRGVLTVVAVKNPGFGDHKKENLRDICAVTGATVIASDAGMKLEDFKVEQAGGCATAKVDATSTLIVGGKGKQDAIDGRIALIKADLEKAESAFDKTRLNERLGKLTGGIATIRVGAATEAVAKEIKQRLEDSINATKAALEEGIVEGGGMALLACYGVLKNSDLYVEKHSDITAGRKAFLEALLVPAHKIAENAGESGDVIVKDAMKRPPSEGFNAANGTWVNLKEAGIIDAVKVTRLALQNAAAISGSLLTTEAVVYEVPAEKPQASAGF